MVFLKVIPDNENVSKSFQKKFGRHRLRYRL